MKNTKMLFLLMATMVISVNAITINFQQLIQKDVDAMHKAEKSLYDVITNCDNADGNHELRMNDLRDNSRDLSVSEFNHIVGLQLEYAVKKYNKHHQCNDCRDTVMFVMASDFVLSRAEHAGKGDMSVMDLRKELTIARDNK